MIQTLIKDDTKHVKVSFNHIYKWLLNQTEFEFDIETNMTDWWCDKEIRTLQFGAIDGSIQYVVEWSLLTDEQKDIIKTFLEDWKIVKLIHNGTFEYVVCRFHGIEIHNIYDTMLAEKILTGGIENENYALADLTWKYLRIVLDKSYQTRFGEEVLTDDHIDYAAIDVKHLSLIRTQQLLLIEKYNLQNVLKLENKALLAFSDITYYGMTIDKDRWLANLDWAQPALTSSLNSLNGFINSNDALRSKAIELKYLSSEDRILINPRSYQQKFKLLTWVYPDIHGSSLIILKKYLRDCKDEMTNEKKLILSSLIAKDFDLFLNYIVKNFRKELIDEGWLIPAGTLKMNWNSVDQALPLLKTVAPRMRNLNKETIGRQAHEIFQYYSEYKDKYKAVSTYGEKFFKYIEPDGRVRTNINQIISTGRVSSSNPNMQNLPNVAVEQLPDEFVYIYRDPFGPNFSNYSMVSSDFSGQELGLIAHIAKDEKWFEAIQHGYDLHSMTAEMVFKKQWTSVSAPDCAYVKHKKKCKCPGHMKLRDAIKTINFGLAYGMSAMKLASTLRISKKEAEALINEYFKAFPKIKQVLNYLGHYGVKHGYIKTLAPFFRRRWFPQWKFANKHADSHISGVMYDHTLGAIERQSKNAPIQGSGGDMMKLAMVYTYEWIRKNKYVDRINIVMQVHDQMDTECETALSNMWAKQLDDLMIKAGKQIVTSGILKADTHISPRWKK